MTQVQQASQTNTTIQSVGSAGQQAVALATQPSPGSAPQAAATITQLQLGCLTACSGTTTSDPSTAALTQFVLSELSSLVPPSDSPSLQPTPGTEQSVVDQLSCQVQEGGPAGTQTQTAVQTNATVQVVLADLPSLLALPPAAQTVDQTQQQTWQLQIGCLFYCADTQQVQQAQQSTTTIEIVSGQPGGSGVAVVQQSIWQLQIGCLAWCWDATQAQQASSQSATVVVTSVPIDAPSTAGTAPPAPPAAPSPSLPDPVGSPPPSVSPMSAGGTPVASRSAPVPVATVRLVGAWRRAGPTFLGSRLPAPSERFFAPLSSAVRVLPTPDVTARRDILALTGHRATARPAVLRRTALPELPAATVAPAAGLTDASGAGNQTLILWLVAIALTLIGAIGLASRFQRER